MLLGGVDINAGVVAPGGSGGDGGGADPLADAERNATSAARSFRTVRAAREKRSAGVTWVRTNV